ncbi:Hypothetical_protein [Hexamita inflata]|uniref:Hypothetical_protein n=1 Tax=Hexamita inflata TaxID=28002 RepID=A0AA86Q888_9EUKA|nr:Hypothetical protein HINF_LOCUS38937 [Hexamita inflata]
MQNINNIQNSCKPLAKISKLKQLTRKKTFKLINKDIFDISECSSEMVEIPILKPYITKRLSSINDNNQSYEVIWDTQSKSEVKMKTLSKTLSCITDISISTCISNENCFDIMQLFSELGI